MRLILFIASIILVTYESCSAVEASSPACQLGPLYQCQNVNTSLQCRTFNECIPHWRASKAPQVISTSYNCQFCTILLVDVQNILRSDIAKEEAAKAASQLCEDMTMDSLKAACHLFVNTYLKAAMDMLAQDINPQVVCRAVHACSGAAYLPQNFSTILRLHFHQKRIQTLQQERANNVVQIFPGIEKFYLKVTPTECDDCKRFVVDLKNRLISNVTEQQLEAIFDEAVCSALPPSVRNLCREVVHIYVHQLLALLDQQLDPQQFCSIMGFCTADQLAILQKVVIRLQNTNKYVNPNVASSQCNLCKGVLSRARMLLDDPLAEAKIEGFVIAEICPLVTSIDDNKCRLLVKLFVPSLLHLLRSGMDPMLVCESLHLCVKESVSTQTVTPVPTPTLPRHEIDLPPFLMKQPSNGGSALRTEVVGELSFCQMCDVLLKVVRKRGAAFTTKPAVVTAMREVCMVFPDHIAHRCDQLVNAHGGELALAHFRHASSMSDTTCPLSACRRSLSDSNSLLFEPLEASRTTPRPTRDNSISCAFCKRLIKEAEDYLRRNHTEQELENYLISWCQSAPQQYRDECVSLIRQYLPYIIDALVMEADPSTICSGLHLCATEVYSKLLGRRRCTWGPSYWCSSVFNAHSCYAVEHCQKNVWLGPKPPRRNKPAINI